MARIEISLEEYNSLKSKVSTLEKIMAEKNVVINQHAEVYDGMKGAIDYLTNDTTFLDRLFRWKTICKQVRGNINLD